MKLWQKIVFILMLGMGVLHLPGGGILKFLFWFVVAIIFLVFCLWKKAAAEDRNDVG